MSNGRRPFAEEQSCVTRDVAFWKIARYRKHFFEEGVITNKISISKAQRINATPATCLPLNFFRDFQSPNSVSGMKASFLQIQRLCRISTTIGNNPITTRCKATDSPCQCNNFKSSHLKIQPLPIQLPATNAPAPQNTLVVTAKPQP